MSLLKTRGCQNHSVKINMKTTCINSSPPSAAYVSLYWVSTGSGNNGLPPARHQAITWTSAGLLSIWLLGANLSEIQIRILSFSFTKMHLKLSSAKVAAILARGRWVNLWVMALAVSGYQQPYSWILSIITHTWPNPKPWLDISFFLLAWLPVLCFFCLLIQNIKEENIANTCLLVLLAIGHLAMGYVELYKQ